MRTSNRRTAGAAAMLAVAALTLVACGDDAATTENTDTTTATSTATSTTETTATETSAAGEGAPAGPGCQAYAEAHPDGPASLYAIADQNIVDAIQNIPEGAIISMPLRAEGQSKGKAFAGGVLSGIVEPIGAVLTILAAQLIIPALPYLLSFAAGAMLYVVVEELIPEMSQGRHSNVGTVLFAVGFSVMMVLDVALG